MGVRLSLRSANKKEFEEYERLRSIIDLEAVEGKESMEKKIEMTKDTLIHDWYKDMNLIEIVEDLYKENTGHYMTDLNLLKVDKETLKHIIHILTKELNAIKEMREGEGEEEPCEEEKYFEDDLKVFNRVIESYDFDNDVIFFSLD